MAKKSKPENGMIAQEAEWQARDDVNNILSYQRLCEDKDRFNRAKGSIRKANRMLTRGGRRSSR